MSSINILKAKQLFDEYDLLVEKVNKESIEFLDDISSKNYYVCPVIKGLGYAPKDTEYCGFVKRHFDYHERKLIKNHCLNCILNKKLNDDKKVECTISPFNFKYRSDTERVVRSVHEAAKSIYEVIKDE